MSNQPMSTPVVELVDDGRATGVELPRERIFEILRNRRRQYVLHYLMREAGDQRVGLRELVDQVAAWENDTSVKQLDSDVRKSVYTALRQSHLPKLHEVGIVEYDNLRGEVALTDVTRDVYMYLEYVPGDDISWSQYYLWLSGICSVLTATVWIGVFPFSEVPGIALAGLFVGLFALSSVVHARHPSERGPKRLDTILVD